AFFTEITDKMESEDLTQMINHYLTEMSQVALDHGATIDKYIGDGIMIFFGDPETRGVKEDALACVTMALAMQSRMAELADTWRDSGIESPMQCRIGIHTGYCTVGNFGSADRMDYTIIGGTVNLAARMEGQCLPGAVLMSYDTYALVRDQIACEEVGLMSFKGLAYPIRTYRAVHVVGETAPEQISLDLPHIRIAGNLSSMEEDEREQARLAIEDLLTKLS
ncbi:MAG: adenylate/guanylate cyclase domain-containing protein, partial [Pseudomonadota bacterium]